MKKLLLLGAIGTLVLAGCTTVSPDTLSGALNSAKKIQQQQDKNNQQAQQIINNTNTNMPTPTAKQAIIKTNLGDITVEFYADESPKTVQNFITLAQQGFYDGTKFHRVIKDFMIQGGDPLTKDDSKKSYWGTGDPGYKFADEFNNHPLVRGSLAMANSGPNTNGSQFFIVTAESTPWLDGKHTNFGQVVSGLETVDKIEASPTDSADRPLNAVVIEKIELK